MSRGHWHPSTCRVCGISVEEAGNISQQGFCPEHGRERMEANLDQLRDANGPYFDHWLDRIRRAVGVIRPSE